MARRVRKNRKRRPWWLGRIRVPRILRHLAILDHRPDETKISQLDEIEVECLVCHRRDRKPAVAIERHPDACQRCAGKEPWCLGRLRSEIQGKRLLVDANGVADKRGDDTQIRLTDILPFKCLTCGDIKQVKVLTVVRLKTATCNRCKERRQWTLGDFRKEVLSLGGTVLELLDKPDTTPIFARQDILVMCPFGHRDRKTPQHVSEQQTLCLECGLGRSERFVRAMFEAMFGELFPQSRPSWLRNHKTGYGMQLDGYCESLQLAFEHDGPHHDGRGIFGQSEAELNDVQERDALKNLLCDQQGVRLIRIPGLNDRLPREQLRPLILEKCAALGIVVPNPDAEVSELAITPDDVRLLAEVRAVVESRGGRLISENYLGSSVELEIDCGNGHRFYAAPHKLKDKQYRWCRECYRERLRREGAERHGYESYYARVVAHLKVHGCILLTMESVAFDARTSCRWKCACGVKRCAPAAQVIRSKYHGLCRTCIALQKKRAMSGCEAEEPRDLASDDGQVGRVSEGIQSTKPCRIIEGPGGLSKRQRSQRVSQDRKISGTPIAAAQRHGLRQVAEVSLDDLVAARDVANLFGSIERACAVMKALKLIED